MLCLASGIAQWKSRKRERESERVRERDKEREREGEREGGRESVYGGGGERSTLQPMDEH